MISRIGVLLVTIAVVSVAETLEDFRLPQIVIPMHYNLQILTDLQNEFYYKGKVSIELSVTSPTKEIVMHSKNLKIFENETQLIEEKNYVQSGDFSKIKEKSLQLGTNDDEENVLDLNKFAYKENRNDIGSRVVVPYKKTNSSGGSSAMANKEQSEANDMSEYPFVFAPGNAHKNDVTSEPPKINITSAQGNYPTENQRPNFEGSTSFSKVSTTTSNYVKSTLKPSVTFLYGTTNFPKQTYESTSSSSPFYTFTNIIKQTSSSFSRYPTTTAISKNTNRPKSTVPTTFTHAIKNTSKPTPPTVTFTSAFSTLSTNTNKIVTTASSLPIKNTYPTEKTYKSTTMYPNKFQPEMEKTSSESFYHFTQASNYESTTSTKSSTEYKATAGTILSTTVNHKEATDDFVPKSFMCEKHDYKLENDFLILRFNETLSPGKKYKLHLSFEGMLTDTLVGFHRVPYTKKGSQKSSWLASTVFEPNEARSAFPCFDEPIFKATFDVSLGHEKKYTALSNMPLETTTPIEDKPEWQWSTFKTTPKMSTYLLAFFISDFEYLSPRQNQTKDGLGVKYRFWARHDVLYKARYAMRIAPEMKNYLENLLQVRDVLPKHDFVAVPSFISSALENWGLIAFAEKNLLFTPGFSSIFSKFDITQVVGHEIAHIWFGNMVTPKWWDQIWLSEGFSNFFELLAVDHVQPHWDIKTVSAIFSYLKLFSLDAFESSHPLIPKLDDPNDLNDVFDSITYQKGFLLVRMLNYTLGQEAFLNGTRKYLKANLLSNTDDNDLWEALNEYAKAEGCLPSGFDLKAVMHSWTRETGYPIVEIIRDYENNTATITQQRFVRSRGDFEFRENSQNSESEEKRWWIPITYTTGSEHNFGNFKPRLWLNPSDAVTIMTDMPRSNDFVLFNLDVAGMYRVNYDEQNWDLLISYLLSENYFKIPVVNRVQILDDLLDLARAGRISYEKALDATSYLSREKHFLPWKAALSNFDFISRMFRSTESSQIFKRFLRNLVAPRFQELGFDSVKNESLSDGFNRKQIVKWACKTGMRQCIRKSVAVFKKWMEEKKPDEVNPIPGSLRSVVYCTAIEHGGAREWQFLWQRYLHPSMTDRTAVLQGLGCSKNSRTLKRYLDWSIKISSGIRKQDAPTVFKAVARNEDGFSVAKYFLKENLKSMRLYLGDNSFLIPQIIDAMASKMNQYNDLEELEEIEQENYSEYRSAPRSLKQAIERVKFNIDWVEKNSQTITHWLNKQKI